MTAAARKVLEDCIGATQDLRYGVQGGEWRRRWITAVVLLRTVGHVLEKVDAATNSHLGQIINSKWEELKSNKPEPIIFWEFIDQERNNILKEYQIGAGQGVTVRPGGIKININTGETTFGESQPTLYHYPINSGPFNGRDQKEVLEEAIQWWDNYLTTIETTYNRNNNT